MYSKNHNLLRYVLIILLMLAPLRSVLASQLMACGMDMSAVAEDVAISTSSSVRAAQVSEHCQHMQKMAADNAETEVVSDSDHLMKRCCDSNSACSADCHFSITLSLFLPRADYSPVLLGTGIFENISTTPIVRELAPPSRPPLSLYS